jgi:hypothetical protein
MGELRSRFVIPLSAPTSSISVSDKVLKFSLPKVNSSASILTVDNNKAKINVKRFIELNL